MLAFTVPVSAVDESSLELSVSDSQPGATDVSHSWEAQVESFEGGENLDRIELDYSGTGVDIEPEVLAGDFVVSVPDVGVLETTDVIVENNVVTIFVTGTVSSGNTVSITSNQIFTNPSEIGSYEASIQFFGDTSQSTVGTTQFSIGSGVVGTVAAEDGTAIQDLLVDAVGGPETLTDANGAYDLNLEPNTEYDIRFEKEGYVRRAYLNLSVTENETIELNEVLPGEMILDPLSLNDTSPGAENVEYSSLLTAQNPVTGIEYISINLSRAGDISLDQATGFTVVRNGVLVESSVYEIDGQRVLLDVFDMPDLAAGDELEVTATGVTNPTEPGTYELGVGFREGEGGTPAFPKTGGGSLFQIEDISGTVDLGDRITEDQNSIAVNVTFDNTANGDAFLVVENRATGESTSQFVQSDGPVGIDVTALGGITADDEIEAVLYESSDLVNTLDNDTTIVEANADPSGTVALEDGITEDQSTVNLDVSFSNTAGGDAFVLVENRATGQEASVVVEQDTTVSVDVADLGGISGGDEIEARLYETTDLVTTLDTNSTIVEAVTDPTGTVTLEDGIREDQEIIDVNVSFNNTVGDDAIVVIENLATGEGTDQIVEQDGVFGVNVTAVGGISGGDELEVTLYETTDLVTLLDNDSSIVEAVPDPTGTVVLEDEIREDQTSFEVTVTFENIDGVALELQNSGTKESQTLTVTENDTTVSVDVTNLGGISAGDEIEVTLYETTDLVTTLDSDMGIVESVPDPTGTVALEDGITENQESINLDVTFENTTRDDAFLVVENLANAERTSVTVEMDGTVGVAVADIGGITAGDEIEATLYETSDLVTVLDTGTGVVEAASEPVGSVAFEPGITEAQNVVGLDVSFENTQEDTVVLTVTNENTGESIQPIVIPEGAQQVDVDALGGIDAGDSLTAEIYETTDLDVVLDTAETTVEAVEQPDGTVTLEDRIRGDQETFSVGVTFENLDSVALEVENLRTGERVTETIDANGEISVSVADIGGIAAGDEIEATVYQTAELLEPLDTDTTAVQAAPEPYFGTDITDFTAEVTEGETVEVTAGIVNIGDVESTQTVQFVVRNDGGDVVFEDSVSVTLRPDQVRVRTISYTTSEGDAPELTVTVSTDDETDTVPVSVAAAENEQDDDEADEGGDEDDQDEREEEITVQENRTSVNSTTRNVQAGDEVSVDIPEPSDPQEYHMEQVNLTASVDAAEVRINTTTSTEPLPDTPDGEFEFNGTTQLGYLDAESNLDNEEIEEVKFTFRISEERIEALESGPEDVALYRFNEETGEWESYETEFIERRGGNLVFQTFADTFSDWTAAAQTPEMSITDTEVDVDVATINEDINIQVFVTNTGGADGSYEAELITNDEVVDREDATVPSNATVIINFIRTFDQPGEYEIRVNDVPVGQLEISEEDEEVTVDSSESEDDGDTQEANDDDEGSDDGFGFGFGVLPAIAGVVVVSLFIARFRRLRRVN